MRSCILWSALCAARALAQSSLPVTVSATAPGNVSPTVDPSFPAFAFEERSFYYYAGPGGQPNKLSQNLVNAVASRTNVKPVIRAGGSSLNAAKYDSSQSSALVIPSKVAGHGIPIPMTIGPSFFDAFANFDAMYVFDIMMDPKTDVNSAVEFAKAGYTAIGADNIAILELGNEVNSYSHYTPSDYTDQFSNFSAAISSAIGISTDDPRWQVGSLANEINPQTTWNVSAMFTTGGLSQYTSRLRSFSVHYYQTAFHSALNVGNTLMNHGHIVGKLSQYVPQVAYCASMGLAFNIEEVGCAPGTVGGDTGPNERTLGSALWQVDFMLYAMSIGVHRINMQSGLGFDFSLWAGVDFTTAGGVSRPQEVYANYYAQVFVADFISTSGATQALNIDLGTDSASAYAAYESGKLARVALVNLNFWNGSDSSAGDRANTTFAVQIPGVSSVTVRRLSSSLGAGALDSDDISWAGESWSTTNSGVGYAASTNDTSTLTAGSDGVLNVEVPASEAVMLSFNVGSVSSSSSTSSSSMATSTASSTSSASSTAMPSSSSAMTTSSMMTSSMASSASAAATSSSSTGGAAHAVATGVGLGWAVAAAAVLAI